MSAPSSSDTGCATREELRARWRMLSTRAARDHARRRGVRRHRGLCPSFAIWVAEGLAPPPRWAWDALKLPHLVADDLAARMKEAVRTARCRDMAKPGTSFPDPVALRQKPKLWRMVEADRWIVGMPGPVVKRAGPGALSEAEERPKCLARKDLPRPSTRCDCSCCLENCQGLANLEGWPRRLLKTVPSERKADGRLEASL